MTLRYPPYWLPVTACQKQHEKESRVPFSLHVMRGSRQEPVPSLSDFFLHSTKGEIRLSEEVGEKQKQEHGEGFSINTVSAAEDHCLETTTRSLGGALRLLLLLKGSP